ncbi:MAG: type 4a pilus biogenesis protein PilO [Phycisphaerales bacterium]
MLFRERQQLTICIATLVMVGGFVLFRYLPLRRKIKAIRQIKSTQILTVAKGSADNQQIQLLKEQLEELNRELKNYESNIPEQRALGEFLQGIADVMNENSLTEQVIEPGVEIKTEKLNCIPVNIKCKGELAQIFKFFQRLQVLDRLVRIEHVKLINNSDFNGEVSMETKAVIYYRTQAGQG